MAYYLVEFDADESLAVVPKETVQAITEKEECVVDWRAPGKKKVTKHAAKILKVGGKATKYYICCTRIGKSSESVQCAMLKACDACADMGQWGMTNYPIGPNICHFTGAHYT